MVSGAVMGEGHRHSTVTNVVDVALQEFFDRYSVPPADHDGRITEQES